jgi:hypothetical protein
MTRYCKTVIEQDKKYVHCYENDVLVKKIDVTSVSYYFIRDVIENWIDFIL